MKKKILKTGIIAMLIILLTQLTVFAAIDKLTIKTVTDNNTYTVGDKVNVTVDWTEGMQAAVFKIKYDANKLTFNSASIANSYYNTDTAGIVSVNWASLEEIDFTKMTFEFTAKTEGKTTISVEEPNFANGNLENPASYDTTTSGSKEITINAKAEEKPSTGNDTNTNNSITNKNNTVNKKDNTTANGKMPQTGAETTAMFTILVLAVFGTIVFIKYKKLSDI